MNSDSSSINKTKINWFPGHMKKALNKISDNLKIFDFVIELLDSRIPLSSKNDYVEKIITNKPKLILLTKTDLSDEKETQKWVKYLTQNGNIALAINLKTNGDITKIIDTINILCKDKKDKALKKGIKNVTLRGLIIGIPNVGKSTLINYLAKKSITKVANTPGLTRNIRFVRIKDIELADTPGVLEPQYEDQKKAINLALVGSIKNEILPKEELVNYCLDFLKQYYLNALKSRYKLGEITDNYQILEKISKNRGFFNKNNELNIEKAIDVILNEFKNGVITKFSLERIDA